MVGTGVNAEPPGAKVLGSMTNPRFRTQECHTGGDYRRSVRRLARKLVGALSGKQLLGVAEHPVSDEPAPLMHRDRGEIETRTQME